MPEEKTPLSQVVGASMPTHGSNHFAAAVNSTEILLTLGQTRVVMVDVNGVPTPRASTEWFLTLSISPSAAKNLQAILSAATVTYEEKFGKIPSDPNGKLSVDNQK